MAFSLPSPPIASIYDNLPFPSFHPGPYKSASSTRFVIFSHSQDLLNRDKAYIPSCDVLIHCGSIRRRGSTEDYHRLLAKLATLDMELKLVIAGLDDLALDPQWLASNPHWARCYPRDHQLVSAYTLFTSQFAKNLGVHYLEEGTHTFTLKSGASFTVYARPYRSTPDPFKIPDLPTNYSRRKDSTNLPPPQYCRSYLWDSKRYQDRFATHLNLALGNTKYKRFLPPKEATTNFNKAKITPPKYSPNIDIIIEHGPPAGALEELSWTKEERAKKEMKVGLATLIPTISAQPRLHCFGHHTEEYDGHIISWQKESGGCKHRIGAEEIKLDRYFRLYLSSGDPDCWSDKITLMTNTSIKPLEILASPNRDITGPMKAGGRLEKLIPWDIEMELDGNGEFPESLEFAMKGGMTKEILGPGVLRLWRWK